MSKTLFFYLFKDLVRIFLMASGALAGIMSFAGLLRPLTENGLDLGQVSRILRYMSPAMTTYSLPVAALFATTVVYGRFSSDNELTAMRAGGISYLSMRRFSIALPALVLGLMVALISLVLLCFIVPIYSLKVEEVIYSNIAKVIASKIEKNHEVDFRNPGSGEGELDVFAQEAHLMNPDPSKPNEQSVELIGPAIVTYETPDPSTPQLRVPKEFWMAGRAMVTISRSDVGQGAAGSADLRVRAIDSIKFPRLFRGNVQAGVADTKFGPLEIPSMIGENVKFMNVSRLEELSQNPEQSQKVQTALREITRREQEQAFLDSITAQLNSTSEANMQATLATALSPEGENDSYVVAGQHLISRQEGSTLILTGAPAGAGHSAPVHFRQLHDTEPNLWATAAEIHIRSAADAQEQVMAVSIELYDAQIQTGDVTSNHKSFIRSFDVPMTPAILALQHKPLSAYAHDPELTPAETLTLDHEQMVVNNAVYSELHSRAAFALSCLVLVMVGCALGTMFRSGNFLTAFAVSFIPALLVITLIVCGQQVATRVPYELNLEKHNPLHLGLWFIWVGNLIVLGVAVHLTAKLQKR